MSTCIVWLLCVCVYGSVNNVCALCRSGECVCWSADACN